MDRIPYRQLQNLTFSIYRPLEIKKLSVLEVTNPNAFDTMEHPTAGGLYDPHMGPTDSEEPCETCGLRSVHCPGHVGHINLPFPVFNPVFMRTLYQLLQGSCFQCHRLMAIPSAICLTLCQFQALDYGLVGTVQELAEAVKDPTFMSENALDLMDMIEQKLKSIIARETEGLDLAQSKGSAQVKSVVECRQRIMKDFIRMHLTKHKQKCPHCNARKAKLALRYNNRFVFGAGKKEIRAKYENPAATNEETDMAEENIQIGKDAFSNSYLTPLQAKEHLTLLWKQDSELLKHLFGILNVGNDESPVDMFFTEILIVPPTRFRPISVVKGRKYLNPQSAALKDVLSDCVLLNNLARTMKGEAIDIQEQDQVNKIPGKTNVEKLNFLWLQLQTHVNCVYDTDLDKINKDKVAAGVKQVLEKKEGLFRKHMMGKRVNFAARSVISPDPYIMVDEIGVPMVFAKKLTYPTPVTDWNVELLRKAVMNGPDVYPGADKIEAEDGKIIKLNAKDPVQRQAVACALLTPPTSSRHLQKGIPKKVHRHVQNGDVLLLNRQPTLHKPSIMAHRARVLPGEKTLRLHYANCKAYNADFDGDEMNAHFPQSELARAEGYHIVSVNHQYLVPKDGTPLSGLIQDHIIASTLLTMRGRFFTRDEYQQLVYSAVSFVQKVVKTLPPCIIKPKQLWSGKQVFSTVILNIVPEGKALPTLEGKAKVSSKNWQNAEPRKWMAGGTLLKRDVMTESEVIIHNGELLCGVIDKAHIGPTPYGLVHCCYEFYGGETSSALLTSLARLFTHFLQVHSAFTLGIEDILLTEKATKSRRKVMRRGRRVGNLVVAEAFDVDDAEDEDEITQKFKEAHLSKNDLGLKTLDYEMKKKTDKVNNDINTICMPDGLLKKFPYNSLQLMVQSGAKGSTVNAMQISCLLGQIELEGRRVPLMLNGSTLPSFLPYDTSPRAGGFVDGRFLTGIRPQEFFFHCMAGREGLVDTAVKTSRSGYLQRCLIKHLEGIVVNYDLTVRDSDGSVIQFLYGEDGLDISKMQMLKEEKINLLARNYNAVVNEQYVQSFLAGENSEDPAQHKASIAKWKHKYGNKVGKARRRSALRFAKKIANENEAVEDVNKPLSLVNLWYHLGAPQKEKYYKRIRKCPDPVSALYRPDVTFGAVSEKLDSIIESYVQKNLNGLLKSSDYSIVGNEHQRTGIELSAENFRRMTYYRALNALAHPGEAVGLLAAQSVGEPSTQMTLNTFHFAGRGEMNVTLGIPRLREILMVASANIATPTMDLPLYNKPGVEETAEKLRIKLSAVHLKQVLESIEVTEFLCVKGRSNRFRRYMVNMHILPHKVYKGNHYATPESVLLYIEDSFIPRVVSATKKKLASLSESRLLNTTRKTEKRVQGADMDNGDEVASSQLPVGPSDFDEGGSSDEEGGGDEDTVAMKTKSRHNQDLEYEEPEPEENVDDPDEVMADCEDTEIKEEPAELEDNLNTNSAVPEEILTENMHSKDEKSMRIKRIVHKYEWVSDYDYDAKKMLWCQFTLQLRLQNSKIDMRTVIEDEAASAIVYKVPNIKKAFLVKNPNSSRDGSAEKMLKTDGVNFLEVFKYVDIIDTRKLYSNDIHAIANVYGIEAAARVIVKEITNVFATYGIEVDPRHLLLIADYMTFDGTYKPCNRIGMSSNASPLQQMTFETTMNFLQSAALTGSEDQLKSPSSRLVVGQLVSGGTGFFDLWLKPHHVNSAKKRNNQ